MELTYVEVHSAVCSGTVLILFIKDAAIIKYVQDKLVIGAVL